MRTQRNALNTLMSAAGISPATFAFNEPVEKPPEVTNPVDNIDTRYALGTGRKTYLQEDLDQYEQRGTTGHAYQSNPGKANLLSSELQDGMHKPVIDCDYPVLVMESSTPGHGHLYIEQPLTWDQYKALLEGFHKAGLIQDAWYQNALKEKRSYVRLPHIKKPEKTG